MARKPRLFIADFPYHVTQRGNNKSQIFFSKGDYQSFSEILLEAKCKHPCCIFAYCFMPNHVHLMIQPKEKDNVSLLMKLLAAKYAHYINKAHSRTGTLWEGRFKCCLIGEELYFLTCLYYIETNPVRAGIVGSPELYQWSSYRAKAFGEKNSIIDLSDWYLGLGPDAPTRQIRYRQFFQNFKPDSTTSLIREMTNKGAVVGSASFKEEIERKTGRKLAIRQPGRPKTIEK